VLLRAEPCRVIFTNGVFDILHAGHVTYLEEARALGDVLVVGLNSDDSVRRLKGPTRPVNTQEDRARVLGALRCVDHVIVFDDDTPLAVITALIPDVLVKGGDYTRDTVVGADVVEHYGGSVVIIPLLEGRSTTSIIARSQGRS
jgi:D-beta-D-heptose 7-phosphate kinase/D-beta-D-heptose 1-phosphate adenosyltransferase